MSPREHALGAAADLGLTVNRIRREIWEEDRVLVAWAEPANQEIWVPAITDEWSYIAALHEVGHCSDPVQVSWKTHDKIHEVEAEVFAWRWVLEHAALPISRSGIGYMRRSFKTYLDWYEFDHLSFEDEILTVRSRNTTATRVRKGERP